MLLIIIIIRNTMKKFLIKSREYNRRAILFNDEKFILNGYTFYESSGLNSRCDGVFFPFKGFSEKINNFCPAIRKPGGFIGRNTNIVSEFKRFGFSLSEEYCIRYGNILGLIASEAITSMVNIQSVNKSNYEIIEENEAFMKIYDLIKNYVAGVYEPREINSPKEVNQDMFQNFGKFLK